MRSGAIPDAGGCPPRSDSRIVADSSALGASAFPGVQHPQHCKSLLLVHNPCPKRCPVKPFPRNRIAPAFRGGRGVPTRPRNTGRGGWTRPADYGLRSRHWEKFGLLVSMNGTGRLTSLPKTPPLLLPSITYGFPPPPGNSAAALPLYCRPRRRGSPSRCPVRYNQKARSRNVRSTRAESVPGSASGWSAGKLAGLKAEPVKLAGKVDGTSAGFALSSLSLLSQVV